MSPVALADSPRAQDLRGLTIGEKLEWGLLRRRRGNALFEEGKYVEATGPTSVLRRDACVGARPRLPCA